jgi:hypothetical protein
LFFPTRPQCHQEILILAPDVCMERATAPGRDNCGAG